MFINILKQLKKITSLSIKNLVEIYKLKQFHRKQSYLLVQVLAVDFMIASCILDYF